MDTIDITWYSLRLTVEDTRSEVTRKLLRKGVDLLEVPHSVYVIRFSSTFIVEYSLNCLSPVVYVGQGALRGRLNKHRGWLARLQELLPGAPIEVSFCFPRDHNGQPVNKEYEAHLLKNFKSKFTQLPLRNRQHQRYVGGYSFNKKGEQQVLGHGIGKKYIWAIKPLAKKVPFTKYAHSEA